MERKKKGKRQLTRKTTRWKVCQIHPDESREEGTEGVAISIRRKEGYTGDALTIHVDAAASLSPKADHVRECLTVLVRKKNGNSGNGQT